MKCNQNIIKMQTLFKSIVGSNAYGTNIATSDIDTMSIFKYPLQSYLRYSFQDTIVKSKGDEVDFEIGRFIHLLGKSNPTVFQLLWTPERCILESSAAFEKLREMRHQFLSKACRVPFIGYAKQQLQKAQTANRRAEWEKKDMQRLSPMDFCWVILDAKMIYTLQKQGVISLEEYLKNKGLTQHNVVLTKLQHTKEGHQLFIQDNPRGIVVDDSNNLRVSETPIDAMPIATVLYNLDGYSHHCKEYADYIKAKETRNKQRYIDNGEKTYDVKNLMHTVRLVNMAEEIATKGEVYIDRTGIDADYLKAIRQGQVDLHEIFLSIEEKVRYIDELFDKSQLPDQIEIDIEALIVEMRS